MVVRFEPPCKPVIRTVLEIYDRVLVPIQLITIESVVRAMHRRRVEDSRVAVDGGAVELGKYRGGRDSVETIAVIKYP